MINVAIKLEMEMCFYKGRWHSIFFTLARYHYLKVSKILPLLSKDVDHINGTASTKSREKQLHGAHTQVLSSNIW